MERGEEITVTGIVQGVGFRPFVYRLALRLALRGSVRNAGDRVVIHAGGTAEALDAFAGALTEEAPPLARVAAVRRAPAPLPEAAGFTIAESGAGTVSVGIVPDVATCPACLAEMADPGARRYRYAFTNCTDCGPRFSIVTGLPYDRPATTMAGFTLCPACRAEYENPADRRFHAQPVACPECGPRLWVEVAARESGSVADVDADPDTPRGMRADTTPDAGPRPGPIARPNGDPVADPIADAASDPATFPPGDDAPSPDAIAEAAQLLLEGRILAVKGIGGFHLACDATSAAAVALLRARKHRPTKPLAVMAPLPMAEALCLLDDAARAALAHPAAPILLLPLKPGTALAAEVAPGQSHLGVMLPYAPLHHLLLEAVGRPLVMTSGNRSSEPQAFRDAEARASLSGIADAFLMHDRPIARRLDDSVGRIAAGRLRVMRRGRGLAPMPLALPEDFAQAPAILAMGGELKSAFCLTDKASALLSHHLGDLDEPATSDAFEAAHRDYAAIFRHRPAAVAVDLHPDYRASRRGAELAAEHVLPLLSIAHHHAHIAATLAEAGWRRDQGPVVGIALDGLGLGADGALWGAEILLCDYRAMERRARLCPIPLAGGDAASREPFRVLLAHLDRALGREKVDGTPRLAALFAGRPLPTLRAMMDKGLNAPLASSAGRLFDAMAALLGLAPLRLSHEGEAAMALEALAFAHGPAEPYPLARREQPDGLVEIDPTPLWRKAVADLEADRPMGAMAAAFHAGLAEAFAAEAAALAGASGLGTVALSGGVFQNAVLLEEMIARLSARGLQVLVPAEIPANDGGLALGQAVVAAARLMARD